MNQNYLSRENNRLLEGYLRNNGSYLPCLLANKHWCQYWARAYLYSLWLLGGIRLYVYERIWANSLNIKQV